MFDRLIDVVGGFLDNFVPAVVLDEYERGIVLRLGRFNRELGPGWHIIIPFGIEEVFSDNVVPRVWDTGKQSLTTSDGKSITVETVFHMTISNIKDSVLKIEGLDESTASICQGCIGDLVMGNTWKDLLEMDIGIELVEMVNIQCKPFGVSVDKFQIKDFTLARPIRLLQ